jgi:hypothetical protein
MSDRTDLEHGYRRLLAWYPRAFRRDHEEEVLAVLMAGAGEGQRRPGLTASADLIRSGMWMRLRPGPVRPPRTVFNAVRLMYAGAVVEVAALVTIVVTPASIRAAILARNPDYTATQWHALLRATIVPDEVAASIAIGLWLLLAWATGRGHGWARAVFAVFFAMSTVSLLAALARDAAVYAPADLIAGATLWLVELPVVLLLFNRRSRPYYSSQPRTG